MVFSFVTLYVQDMPKSLAFYRDLLGLKLQRTFSTPEGEIAFLGEGGQPSIELIAASQHASLAHTGYSVGIGVNSLQEATQHLVSAGYKMLRGPISPSPNTVFSFFEGPDGEEIELIEQT